MVPGCAWIACTYVSARTKPSEQLIVNSNSNHVDGASTLSVRQITSNELALRSPQSQTPSPTGMYVSTRVYASTTSWGADFVLA